jgi:hypothetical protein
MEEAEKKKNDSNEKEDSVVGDKSSARARHSSGPAVPATMHDVEPQ